MPGSNGATGFLFMLIIRMKANWLPPAFWYLALGFAWGCGCGISTGYPPGAGAGWPGPALPGAALCWAGAAAGATGFPAPGDPPQTSSRLARRTLEQRPSNTSFNVRAFA